MPGVKPEKIQQVEQTALDEAEAAKSDIIKKDESKDDTDVPTSPSKR